MPGEACPCKSGQTFEQCCAPLISGFRSAASAEQLMRSRYSAFATGNADYLVNTHHPDSRSPMEHRELQQSMKEQQWLGLIILECQKGQDSDGEGVVEFAAYYQTVDGRQGQLHERSRFVQEAGQWFYVAGDILPPVSTGRNEPCWCGSGRKYKKCHGT